MNPDKHLPDSRHGAKVFIPFSEALMAAMGHPPGELVPFQLEYRCLRLPNGTYEFTVGATGVEPAALQSDPDIVHAA